MGYPLNYLDIPGKILNHLAKAGVTTVDDVFMEGFDGMLKIPGIGVKSMLCIYEQIAIDNFEKLNGDAVIKAHKTHLKDRWQLKTAMSFLNNEQKKQVAHSRPPEGWNGLSDWG